MKNTEIIKKLAGMNRDYLARFVGVLLHEVTNWLLLFKMWLSRYTDSFKSLKDAIDRFQPFYRIRCG
jgi:hypothetical protein